MARMARVVLPGLPHHVLQRGVRSLPLFHSDEDRQAYLQLLATFTARHGVQVWAWCLMTNHVHVVLVPAEAQSLARAIGETHRRYSRAVNFREHVRGHLFQERFHSFPIQDDRHLVAVVRYVECNPVRARIVPRAIDYPWSSARHHATGAPDGLVHTSLIPALSANWGQVLQSVEEDIAAIRQHVRTGRPWGEVGWIQNLEQCLERPLLPRTGGWPKGRSRKQSTQAL